MYFWSTECGTSKVSVHLKSGILKSDIMRLKYTELNENKSVGPDLSQFSVHWNSDSGVRILGPRDPNTELEISSRRWQKSRRRCLLCFDSLNLPTLWTFNFEVLYKDNCVSILAVRQGPSRQGFPISPLRLFFFFFSHFEEMYYSAS